MAHLFEHLMFGQTEKLPPGEFDRLVERTGGESNAATWVDWTYYKLSLPARDLALGRRASKPSGMQHLVLEPVPVEAERDVVGFNERRERVEDDVDGWPRRAADGTWHSPSTRIMRRRSAGWKTSARSRLPDIRAFYRTWYAPNNATIVCVGDFDEDEPATLIAKHYGDIQDDAATRGVANTAEPEQTRERNRASAPKPIATRSPARRLQGAGPG